MSLRHAALALLLLSLTASAAAAYTVYLRDGSKIIASEPFTVDGDKAIIILQNGTRTSIAASEIDMERTRSANQSNLGSALVIEDGKVTELTTTPAPPRKETLSDLIANRRVGPGVRSDTAPEARTAERARVPIDTDDLDFRSLPRRPFRDLEVASEVQRFFRAQGVEQILLYQGSQPGHLLADVVTNSEASVFRALEVAAACLQHVQRGGATDITAFELTFATAEREAGGQFLLDPDSAALLAGKTTDVSAFYVQRVRF